MSTATLKQLHSLVDIVSPSEYELVFRLLMKFVAEDEPLPDEIEAIQKMNLAMANIELCDETAINWN